MEKTDRRLKNFISIMLSIVGAGLLIAGFAVNPEGQIDSSVLVAFGECFGVVAAIFGFEYKKLP